MVFTSNFDTGTVSFAGYSFQGFEPWPFGVPAAYAPRRYILDKILLDAAAEEGVDVREGFAVQEYVVEDGRVVGVRGLTKSGATVVERAHVVVGADGLHSLLARTVGATAYRHKPPLTCAYLSYWADVPTDGLEFYHRTHRAVSAIPTNDDQVCIGLAWRHDEFQEFRRDIEGNFMCTLDIAPSLAERVRGGRRVERIVGTASLPNQFRRPYGDGWVLVGDAGYYRDPITGQGITDAFRSADLASDAIDEFLSGSKGYDDAMSGYEERRNAVSMPMYDVTCRLAALDTPSPESMQLYAAFGEWKAPVP
jgi:flavin-dependent dehydrogenase